MNDIIEPPKEPNGNAKKHDLIAALHGIVEVQTKDTEVKRQELEVRSQEISSNERIAMRSIEAQERYHKDNGLQFNKHLIHKYIYIGAVTALVGVFCIVMVAYGAKDVIIEALKLALAFGGGAFGGYQAGKNKRDSDEA